MLRLGPFSTSTGFLADGRRAAFAAKPASSPLKSRALYPEGLRTGKQAVGEGVEGFALLGVQFRAEPGLVAERNRHDAGMHGATAGTEAERCAAAVRPVGGQLAQGALRNARNRPDDRDLCHDEALAPTTFGMCLD